MSTPVFVSTYTKFVENHDDTIDVFNALSRGKAKNAWLAFNKSVRERGEVGKLDLLGFLIQPVQRVPRYELLLRDLLKVTDESHRDFQALNKAIEAVAQISTNVNDRLRRQADYERMQEIERQTSGLPKKPKLHLVVYGRREVRSGVLTKISRKSNTKRIFFLLRDTAETRQEVARLMEDEGVTPPTNRGAEGEAETFSMLVCEPGVSCLLMCLFCLSLSCLLSPLWLFSSWREL
jgi:RhoGEF domain